MAKVSVRYIVEDVGDAIEFYTTHLSFVVDLHPAPGFAALSRGDLQLLLNAPGEGGGGAGAGTQLPAPGGWNRFQLEVDDFDATVVELEQAGVPMRTGIVEGKGGREVVVEDPSGNPVEIFEPATP